MGIPKLSSYCCGCSLRSGVKFISRMEMVALAIMLGGIIALCKYLEDPITYPNSDTETLNTLYAIFIFIAVITSIQLLFSIILLFGVKLDKPVLYRPWLIFSIINVLVMIAFAILNCIALAADSTIAVSIVITIVIIVLKIYSILVVYNHYLELMDATSEITTTNPT